MMSGNVCVYKDKSVKKSPDGKESDTSDSDSEDTDEDSDSDGESGSEDVEDKPTGLTDTENEQDSDAETDAEKTGNDDTSDGSSDNQHRDIRIVNLRRNRHPLLQSTNNLHNFGHWIHHLFTNKHMSITTISTNTRLIDLGDKCFYVIAIGNKCVLLPARIPELFTPV